ncbi:MAG: ferredoxin:protochlorophyllide reductase (ATP-dependent) subunit B, partial [Burkholderiaceae bacterium]|nr:ferredoxin:protochlorophyllide reductase (ATP-dependent) subunit B [Burkholderiaceae bacterium]
QMGFEGANVLFDTWVHPLMMGLEEHLIGMFRGDAEFHEDAAPSHLGGGVHSPAQAAAPAATVSTAPDAQITVASWDTGAEKELKKIPFFVRAKARRNTEAYALQRGVALITTETLYESKAYYSGH